MGGNPPYLTAVTSVALFGFQYWIETAKVPAVLELHDSFRFALPDMQRRWQMFGKRLQKKQVGMQKMAAEGRGYDNELGPEVVLVAVAAAGLLEWEIERNKGRNWE
ncbi:hypothetical protein CK203_070887 [Vitis vinifera]|uniref:Uncharacterized protein n=1 Tax=Vitis vinifera TaxID=29760 RepID=A0A438E3U1_VITVI|nr:hypothetical protein CK203_070887 [Vitis vinifera]